MSQDDSSLTLDSTNNLLHGQAIAMQYVVYLLQMMATHEGISALTSLLRNVRSVGGTEVVTTTSLGCNWASNILSSLTVELALKALLLKESGHYKHTHDLLELYSSLPDRVQARLECEYAERCTRSLRELFVVHREDFVKWRYLDEDVDSLQSENIELQYAICTILDVHND